MTDVQFADDEIYMYCDNCDPNYEDVHMFSLISEEVKQDGRRFTFKAIYECEDCKRLYEYEGHFEESEDYFWFMKERHGKGATLPEKG